MLHTLRNLLIQRAARLQERPAFSAPDWGTLSYAKLRNRVEGIAFGLLAGATPPILFSATGTAWDWAAEVATAASGLRWEPTGQIIPPDLLGGPNFNHEEGRGAYHHREQLVLEDTAFVLGLSQGELYRRLQRLNDRLGWDHETRIELPLRELGAGATRGALWSALYAGAHAVLVSDPVAWDPAPFRDLL
jgi:hypothetical protein